MTHSTPPALTKTIVALYIQAAFNVLWIFLLGLGTLFIFFVSIADRFKGNNLLTLVIMLLIMGLLLAWTVFVLVIVTQLKKQKRWAWITAIIISALSCCSFPSMILGIISLVGLLHASVIEWFRSNSSTNGPA